MRRSYYVPDESTSGRPLFRDGSDYFRVVQRCSPGSHESGQPFPKEEKLLTNEMWAAASGLSTGIPSEGGFLVPPGFASAIWDALNGRINSLSTLCDTYEVLGESLTLPAPAETSRVQGSLYGGLAAYWTREADQATASKPKFRQIKLEPDTLVALVYATDKLLQSAGPVLADFLTVAAGRALGHVLDAAIVSGDGIGKPLGLLNAGSTVSVAKEGGQAAATVVPANIAKMLARLHHGAHATARWIMHPTVYAQLLQMVTTTAVGTGGSNLFDPATRTLAGFPITVSDVLPVLGTVGDLILWDPQSYALGVQSTTLSTSIHVRFDYAETAFRFVLGAAGEPWLSSAITPAIGSDTLSTCITLATRG